MEARCGPPRSQPPPALKKEEEKDMSNGSQVRAGWSVEPPRSQHLIHHLRCSTTWGQSGLDFTSSPPCTPTQLTRPPPPAQPQPSTIIPAHHLPT